MSLTSSQLEGLFSQGECYESRLQKLILGCEISEEAVIKFVNKLLSNSQTRSKGLKYLNLVINRYSSGLISENALSWMKHCVDKYPRDNLKEMKLTTIGNIVDIAYKDQEFTKKFISEHISKVLDMCLPPHMNSHEKESALKTLAICMKHYGSWFTSHKIKIESVLKECLDDSSKSSVKKAAVAFHYLQQVGGAGVDGVNHRNNFSVSFQKLCATIHNLLDEVLVNETDLEQFSRNSSEPFKFPVPPVDSIKMLGVLSKRIRNCLIFMTKMLTEGFPVLKEFNLQEVLGIVSRGTMIHHCLTVASEKTQYDYEFSMLLNEMQIQLLQLLGRFINRFKTNFLPYSFDISKLLTDCLKKSQNCSCFTSDSSYQEAVYGCLNKWIPVVKCSLKPYFQSQLITCILKDITPVKTNISLVRTADSNKKTSKKAKRRAVGEKIIASGRTSSSNIPDDHRKHTQEKNCSLALSTLMLILRKSYLDIETDLLKDIITTVINTLTEITNAKYPHPYTNPECQAMLYKVLAAFFEQDTLQISIPLPLALYIFSNGSTRNNTLISSTCAQSLSYLATMCQPLCPPLHSSEEFVTRQPGAHEVMEDSEAIMELWGATEIAGEKDMDEIIEKRESAPKINIQEVNIFKMSDSMEVELPEREDAMHTEEELPTIVAPVGDQPGVASTDLAQGTIETETNILREELVSNNEVQMNEVEDSISGMKESETNYLGLKLKDEVLSSNDLEQDVKVSKPKEVDSSSGTQNSESYPKVEMKSEVLSSSDLGEEVQVSSSGLGDVCAETQETENLTSSSVEPTNEKTTAQESECGEPSSKRIRVEEGCSEEAAVEKERQSYEEIDDEFDEDSFVDVVKEDY